MHQQQTLTDKQQAYLAMRARRAWNITARIETNADSGSVDEMSEDVEETKSPRFLTCPRGPWHICDDAEGRTPVDDRKGEVCIDMSGIVVVAYYYSRGGIS